MAGLYFFSAKKYYKIPFELKKIIMMLVVGGILYSPILFIDNYDQMITIMLKIALVILFPIVLYFLNFYEKIEIERIKSILGKK
jgi:hypothetical protein